MTCASNGDRAANLAGRRRMVSKLLRNIMAHDHQFLLHKPHVHLWNGRSGMRQWIRKGQPFAVEWVRAGHCWTHLFLGVVSACVRHAECALTVLDP